MGLRKLELKKEQNTNIEDSLTEFLGDKGYTIVEKLGSGKTRDAYLAQYSSGKKNHLRVVKIPKTEFDQSSICTIINKSKRDLDENEVEISNFLAHPNLVDVLDGFEFENKTITVESYFQNAQSLEELMNKTGSIADESKLLNMFSQIAEGVEYANNLYNKNVWGGILLRDIKPSNILVGEEGFVKLTDFQNAAKKEEILELSLPTRGGTAYTRPELINALVGKKESKASKQTEMYAVAASLYNALTGKDPFKYNIVETTRKEARELTIGSETKKIDLIVDGQIVDYIKSDDHNKRLKSALKEVPRKFRKIIQKGLTMDNKKAYSDITEFKTDLEKLKSPTRYDFLTKFHDMLKPMGITAMAVLSFGGVALLGNYQSANMPQGPTIQDILNHERYVSFNLEKFKTPEDSIMTYTELVPFLNNTSKTLIKVKNNVDNENDIKTINNYADMSSRVNNADKRLYKSLLLSNYLTGWDQEKVDRIYPSNQRFDGRTKLGYVPKEFVLRNSIFNYSTPNIETESSLAAFAAFYLKSSMVRQDNVVDVFANYYLSNEEIHTAMIQSGSQEYFPSSENNLGYSHYVDPSKRDLINKAVSIYMVLDDNGELSQEKVEKFNELDGPFRAEKIRKDMFRTY